MRIHHILWKVIQYSGVSLKSIITLIVTFFLNLTLSWAADINATLIDANSTVYQTLLHTLSKDTNKTAEINLEKSLLEILLQPQKTMIRDLNLTQAKNVTTYRQLFQIYLDDALKLDTLRSALSQDNHKIETIENEIADLDNHSPQLFSMELQDAFYHKKSESLHQQIMAYTKQMQQIKSILLKSLSSIDFQTLNIDTTLKKETQLLKTLQERINRYEIVKERLSLVSDRDKISSIDKQIEDTKTLYQNIIKNNIVTKFMQFSFALQKKDEIAFSIAKEINKKLTLLGLHNIDTDIIPLFQSMENKYLGTLKTITGASEQEFKEMVAQGWNFINQPIIEINKTPISIFKLILSLLVFIMGFVLGALYKRKINNLTTRKRPLTATTRTLLANMGYYIIILIAFFIALKALGITLSSLALIAGALSVGIGFGLQNIVSNFVSGLILMFERSIKIGDYVQIDDQTRGYITDIRMRSTTITTNENIDIIVPNQSFIEHNVVNWTMKDNIRRFSIPFGVKYGTKPEQVIEIIETAVANSELQDDLYNSIERRTRVIMTGMGDSSVNFELFIWVKGDKLRKPKRTASEFYILIYNALYENNIEIPFPQMDLHIRSIDASLPIETLNNTTNSNVKDKH